MKTFRLFPATAYATPFDGGRSTPKKASTPVTGDAPPVATPLTPQAPLSTPPQPRQGYEDALVDHAVHWLIPALAGIVLWQLFDHSSLNEGSGLGKFRESVRKLLGDLTSNKPADTNTKETVSLNEEEPSSNTEASKNSPSPKEADPSETKVAPKAETEEPTQEPKPSSIEAKA